MCVILHCPEGVIPSKSIIYKCWRANPDGVGIGTRNFDNSLSFTKGIMNLELAQSRIKNSKNFKEMVIHFRLASAGFVTPNLTHPFSTNIVENRIKKGKEKFLLFHNGHDFGLAKIADRWNLSDSAIAAMIAEENPEIHLPKFSGKFIYMTNNATNYIGKFFEEDGIYYSNFIWKYCKSFWDKKEKKWKYGLPSEFNYESLTEKIKNETKIVTTDVIGNTISNRSVGVLNNPSNKNMKVFRIKCKNCNNWFYETNSYCNYCFEPK
jgi:hypothetical protein